MTHEFKTEKGEFLAVKMPVKAEDCNISDYNDNLLVCYENSNNDFIADIQLPEGKYELICTTKDATEEQAKEIVDPTMEFFSYLEAFNSLLEREKLYRVNPLCFDPTGLTTSEWQQAEERVGNWVILRKIS